MTGEAIGGNNVDGIRGEGYVREPIFMRALMAVETSKKATIDMTTEIGENNDHNWVRMMINDDHNWVRMMINDDHVWVRAMTR